MNKIWGYIIVLTVIFGCQNNADKTSIYDFIPEDAEVVLQINNFERFKSAIRNNPLLAKTPLKSVLESRLGPLDSLKITGPFLIASSRNQDALGLTFVVRSTHISSNNLSKINQQTVDSIWIGRDQNTTPLKGSNNNHPFNKLSALANKDCTFAIYSATNNSRNTETSLFTNSFLNVCADTENISINGMLLKNKITPQFLGEFKSKAPKAHITDELVPADVSSITTYSVSNFIKDTKKPLPADSTLTTRSLQESFFGTIQEISHFTTTEGLGAAVRSIDIGSSKEALVGFQNIVETFRSVPIYEFDKSSFFSPFGGIFSSFSPSKYTILEDFIVFSDSDNFLHDVIANYQNKNTLANTNNYKDLKGQLSDEVSFQKTFTPDHLAATLNAIFESDISPSDLEDYSLTSYQLIEDDQMTHVNSRIQKDKPYRNTKKIREEFSLMLDNNILGQIQFVKNHSTNTHDIVVQDVKNQLYLISNRGVVQWKKNISGPILGAIQQIDLYKNGRLQMAFATPNQVYVLDRLGRDVSPFPLKFRDDITQPLAVFDYDNEKNYRFLIAQNNALIMYDSRGKRVRGFKYKPQSDIESVPKHIRHLGKDYIVFKEGRNLQILNRRGQVRVPVKESIDFSDQDIYFYNNLWTTLNRNGDLVQVDPKGRVSRQSLGFGAGAQCTTSKKTLVVQWDNYLQIKTHKISLDFGRFTKPQWFYFNDKLYISITDLQANKVWLYNSLGEVFTGFPVYGSSAIDLIQADEDMALEFVCQSSPSGIVMYQLY